jgi:hypothetical protein
MYCHGWVAQLGVPHGVTWSLYWLAEASTGLPSSGARNYLADLWSRFLLKTAGLWGMTEVLGDFRNRENRNVMVQLFKSSVFLS